MAFIYKATLRPSKLDLVTAWLPSRSWFPGGEVRQVVAYRFDDPAGEVGLEALLLQSAGGSVLHVPLTYRGAPLPEAKDYLVGTAEHSVLGERWVYDGCGDPVWVTAQATAVLTGSTQVEEFVKVDARLERRAPTATVQGSGNPGAPVPTIGTVSSHDEGPTTVVRAAHLELVVVRVVGAEVSGEYTLTGSWAGVRPAVLASLRAI